MKRDNEQLKQIYRSFLVKVRRDNLKMIKWLDSKESKNAYILKLIEEDMKQN